MEAGKLNMEQESCFEKPGIGGSRCFGTGDVSRKDLIKGIMVCSANDASVAIAKPCRQRRGFVAEMNEYAKKLKHEQCGICQRNRLARAGRILPLMTYP